MSLARRLSVAADAGSEYMRKTGLEKRRRRFHLMCVNFAPGKTRSLAGLFENKPEYVQK